jgi:hypothetical protein
MILHVLYCRNGTNKKQKRTDSSLERRLQESYLKKNAAPSAFEKIAS